MDTSVLVALVLGVAFLLFTLKSIFMPSRRFNLPPGPRPLPIIGNILLLKKYGSIQNFANELQREYGPIVSFWMGSRLAVLISEPEIIREAMIKQGGVFTERIFLESMDILTGPDRHRGFSTAEAERLRFYRRLLTTDVVSPNRVAEFASIRHHEVDTLIDSLRKESRGNDGLVSKFRSEVRLAIFNMLIGILFGRRLTLDEYLSMDEAMDKRLRMVVGKPRDFIPFLQLFPDRGGEEVQRQLQNTINDLLAPLIEERRSVLSSEKAQEKHTFVDSLLEAQRGDPPTIEIKDSDIVEVCLDVLTAGTETTAVTLEYAVANLVNHPEMQEKLSREIAAVAGEKLVDETHIPRMPYLQAVVKESLRRHSPARVSPPRVSNSPCTVAGYDIPANTTVFQHLEAVAMNSQIWEDPLEFRPARFLDRTVDFTGSTNITLIPFGVGRRICPGIHFGLAHAHLVLGRLVQAFEWKPPAADQLLDLSPDHGLTSPMRHPLTALLREL